MVRYCVQLEESVMVCRAGKRRKELNVRSQIRKQTQSRFWQENTSACAVSRHDCMPLLIASFDMVTVVKDKNIKSIWKLPGSDIKNI